MSVGKEVCLAVQPMMEWSRRQPNFCQVEQIIKSKDGFLSGFFVLATKEPCRISFSENIEINVVQIAWLFQGLKEAMTKFNCQWEISSDGHAAVWQDGQNIRVGAVDEREPVLALLRAWCLWLEKYSSKVK